MNDQTGLISFSQSTLYWLCAAADKDQQWSFDLDYMGPPLRSATIHIGETSTPLSFVEGTQRISGTGDSVALLIDFSGITEADSFKMYFAPAEQPLICQMDTVDPDSATGVPSWHLQIASQYKAEATPLELNMAWNPEPNLDPDTVVLPDVKVYALADRILEEQSIPIGDSALTLTAQRIVFGFTGQVRGQFSLPGELSLAYDTSTADSDR